MEDSRESYLTKRDVRTVERAIQNARAVQQYAEWVAGEASRDESMARNVRRTLNAATSGARIVLWAHNEHIGRVRTGYRRMGAYLDEWYGRDYIPIGFSLDRGEYLAQGTASVGRHCLTPAEPCSYEHVFARAAMPRFIVDLRAARSGDRASAWLRAAMQFRSIGALAAEQQFVSSNLGEMFDLVVFLAETTPRRIGAETQICHPNQNGFGAEGHRAESGSSAALVSRLVGPSRLASPRGRVGIGITPLTRAHALFGDVVLFGALMSARPRPVPTLAPAAGITNGADAVARRRFS